MSTIKVVVNGNSYFWPSDKSVFGTTDNKIDPSMQPQVFCDWIADDRPIVITSKNTLAIAYHLDRLQKNDGISLDKVIVHCTITGYSGTIMESNSPSLAKAVDGYNRLIALLGTDRVVLRIDPIVPTEKGTEVALSVIKAVKDTNNGIVPTRVRCSFLDHYAHIDSRNAKVGQALTQAYGSKAFNAPMSMRLASYNALCEATGQTVETCAEGMATDNACVSSFEANLAGVNQVKPARKERADCGCLSKFELMKSAKCNIGCAYCFVRGN